ncbi:MAG: reactive intermediate/imine deaminase [Firmicutes bacterium HGW-Firmicutes-7]|nr:MAG: reactive intermediate/imine deaminase [Firmicutes bacterium HGW-Firmicutes-7]
MKKVINTKAAPAAIGPYSQAIDTGLGLIFTSGQIPVNLETGEVVEGGIEAQTEQVFVNLKAVLEASGSSFDQVVKATVFLQDLKDFATVNGIYGKYLGKDAPSRSTVQVAGLPKGSLIEIEVIALNA